MREPPRPYPRGIGHPERRARSLLLVGLFVLSLFGAQLIRLQVLDAPATAVAALRGRLSTVVVPALRGNITASDGVLLASSTERRNVTADQSAVTTYKKRVNGVRRTVGVAGVAADLAPILGMPEATLNKTLTGNRRFVYVAKSISLSSWRKVASLGVPGIYSEVTTARSYPTAATAASLVGWVRDDGSAGGGLELLLDKQLQGKPGESTSEQSRDGHAIPTDRQQSTPATPGLDVQLTINSDLQWFAQSAIAQKVEETRALSGTVVVMDVKTGALAAVASYPTFDPNNIGAAAGNLNSRAFGEAFEPGSIAKVMTAAAALQEGVATPTTPVVIPNRLSRAGQSFRDSHDHAVEKLTFAGVIAQSSNIGTMKVGEKVPAATLEKYFRDFGVGAPTGIHFPGETPGIFAKSGDWSGSQRYTVMYGQGLAVNAIQAAGVFQTIANGGRRVPPTLVAATENARGTMTPAPATKAVRVITKPVATTLSQMLEFVVGDGGTAKQAEIAGYRVAGKTGTADRVGANGRYSGKTASFIGFAPADKPKFVVAVILQNPIVGYFGGSTAGPVFKDVMTYALQEFGIPPTGTPPPVMKLKLDEAPTSVNEAESALTSEPAAKKAEPQPVPTRSEAAKPSRSHPRSPVEQQPPPLQRSALLRQSALPQQSVTQRSVTQQSVTQESVPLQPPRQRQSANSRSRPRGVTPGSTSSRGVTPGPVSSRGPGRDTVKPRGPIFGHAPGQDVRAGLVRQSGSTLQ
ncbi:MAG: penicillin-binding transpeptidase domain-containing protein [Actinomycetota bacterium]